MLKQNNIGAYYWFKEKPEDKVKKAEAFVPVKASWLGIDDEFLRYEPKTNSEEKIKKLLEETIKNGVKDFYRAKYDPSIGEYGQIIYEPGKMPAVGKSFTWWHDEAQEFWPERKSRLGFDHEYIAAFGVFMKELVENGMSVARVWNAVCNDSSNLGHYYHSDNSIEGLELTGSREVNGLFDLGNTYKMLASHKEDSFWMAGGSYKFISKDHALLNFQVHGFLYAKRADAVGWIVLEE